LNVNEHVQSFARASCPLVGIDLDQAFTPRLSGVFCCMFFRGPGSLYVFHVPSMSFSFVTAQLMVQLYYVTEQGNVYHYNSSDGIHFIWSRCCVCMVRLRTMDIQSSSREKVARGCSARCVPEVLSSSRNSTRNRCVSVEWCAYQECEQFLTTSSLKDRELPQFQRGKGR
jgi:hypothetical protein